MGPTRKAPRKGVRVVFRKARQAAIGPAFRRTLALPPKLPDLPGLATTIPREQIHVLLGLIEEAKARLLRRLEEPVSASPKGTASTPSPSSKLLTAKEVGDMLGLPPRTVYELAKRKDMPEYLPAVRWGSGSSVRFKLADVEGWIERHRT